MGARRKGFYTRDGTSNHSCLHVHANSYVCAHIEKRECASPADVLHIIWIVNICVRRSRLSRVGTTNHVSNEDPTCHNVPYGINCTFNQFPGLAPMVCGVSRAHACAAYWLGMSYATSVAGRVCILRAPCASLHIDHLMPILRASSVVCLARILRCLATTTQHAQTHDLKLHGASLHCLLESLTQIVVLFELADVQDALADCVLRVG
jgi:hypothetical protein